MEEIPKIFINPRGGNGIFGRTERTLVEPKLIPKVGIWKSLAYLIPWCFGYRRSVM